MTGRRAAQRGGAALLVAFTLLVLLAAGGFAVGRGVLRDLAMAGEAARAAEAAAAADSGLDWFLAWARLEAGRAFLAELGAGQEGAAPAPSGRPAFRVRVRNLGPWPGEPAAPGREEAGPEAPPPVPVWQVVSEGFGGDLEHPFVQVREGYASAPPASEGTGLRWLAWWIVPPGLP